MISTTESDLIRSTSGEKDLPTAYSQPPAGLPIEINSDKRAEVEEGTVPPHASPPKAASHLFSKVNNS